MRKPRLQQSFKNAFNGFFVLAKTERNFQIHLSALAINILLILFLKLTLHDAAIIILACAFVMVAEILNTAIEKICDFVHPEFEPRIGLIKDIAAAAVLLATFAAVITGLLIYSKYLFH